MDTSNDGRIRRGAAPPSFLLSTEKRKPEGSGANIQFATTALAGTPRIFKVRSSGFSPLRVCLQNALSNRLAAAKSRAPHFSNRRNQKFDFHAERRTIVSSELRAVRRRESELELPAGKKRTDVLCPHAAKKTRPSRTAGRRSVLPVSPPNPPCLATACLR